MLRIVCWLPPPASTTDMLRCWFIALQLATQYNMLQH
jgi:hypothetical protein